MQMNIICIGVRQIFPRLGAPQAGTPALDLPMPLSALQFDAQSARA
jgi:hypothetical protein